MMKADTTAGSTTTGSAPNTHDVISRYISDIMSTYISDVTARAPMVTELISTPHGDDVITDAPNTFLSKDEVEVSTQMLEHVIPTTDRNATVVANNTEYSDMDTYRDDFINSFRTPTIVSTTLGLPSVLFNVVLIVVIARTPRLRQRISNVFVCSLASTDAVLGLCLLVGGVALIPGLETVLYDTKYVCLTYMTTLYLSPTASVILSLVISVDRLCYMQFPFRYRSNMTRSKALVAVILSWMVTIGICIVPVFGFSKYEESFFCMDMLPWFVEVYFFGVFFYITYGIIGFNYLLITRIAVLQTRNFKSQISLGIFKGNPFPCNSHIPGTTDTFDTNTSSQSHPADCLKNPSVDESRTDSEKGPEGHRNRAYLHEAENHSNHRQLVRSCEKQQEMRNDADVATAQQSFNGGKSQGHTNETAHESMTEEREQLTGVGSGKVIIDQETLMHDVTPADKVSQKNKKKPKTNAKQKKQYQDDEDVRDVDYEYSSSEAHTRVITNPVAVRRIRAGPGPTLQQKLRSVKMFVVVFGFMFACWMPYTTTNVINFGFWFVSYDIRYYCMLGAYFNSVINPLLFLLINRDIRGYVTAVVCRACRYA